MLIDKNGNIFGKVNVIDVLIIALVVVGGIFGASMLGSGGQGAVGGGGTDGRYRMSFTINVLDDFVIDHIQIGDTVMNHDLNADFGTVVEIERGPSREFHANSDGILVQTSREGFSFFTLTTEVTAQAVDNGIMMNGNRFGVGQSVTLRAGDSIFFPRISGIEEI